ncbi:MAG TPA: NADH-quinone oxidoreductase subunit H [Kofleriaceae bacterium]|nr:NADH-quinone oxidoreductase subunit H [Kofleriaceae bacterium]
MSIVANIVALLVMPVVIVGTINRVKARWAGRRGPPVFQLAFDVWRLARKTSVYSKVTTPVFRLGPMVVLVTALASACIVPLAGIASLVSFPFDFVWFAYVWSFGRVALMLGALDTGSSFEGMGASREATFATLLEPVLFLVAGALCLHGGVRDFTGALVGQLDGPSAVVMWGAAIVALVIVIQVEAARMPVDDPTTHLELTMVHEVMILDHSGPELAMLHLGAAIKLFVAVSVTAMLVNPLAGQHTIAAVAAHLGLCVLIAIALGMIESLIARLKLRVVPQYIVVALVAAGVSLLTMLGRGGHA